MIRAYQSDTGGHFFDAETMRFFGCRVIGIQNLDDNSTLVIMRQLENGFVNENKIYRLARYVPGTDHRCECCYQRDQRGTIDYVQYGPQDDFGHRDTDFRTLAQARKFAKEMADSVRVANA